MDNYEEVITGQKLYKYTHYLYGEAFYGSYKGMRYRMAREPLENVFFKDKETQESGQFMVTVWPEPNSYTTTADELKKSFFFPFTEQGREDAIRCLNEQYWSRKSDWDKHL